VSYQKSANWIFCGHFPDIHFLLVKVLIRGLNGIRRWCSCEVECMILRLKLQAMIAYFMLIHICRHIILQNLITKNTCTHKL